MQIYSGPPSRASEISPSTYYACSASPPTTAELVGAYAALEVFCLCHDQRGLSGLLSVGVAAT
jgi:hypothetical protein